MKDIELVQQSNAHGFVGKIDFLLVTQTVGI
jgi:hypothetical protein